jgi:tetratricopeptide (TPR) repeat protein
MAPEQFKTQQADARTDQFNYCVALYLALYGAHPFGDGQLPKLMAAVTAGRVLPAPPKSAVPLWLRRVLLRGLSVDPAARWESMDALVAALARDPARHRRRWLGAAAIAGAVLAGFVAVRRPRTAESMCRGGSAHLAGVWEPRDRMASSGTRGAATRAAFEQLAGAGGVHAWERAARLLDRYAADWLHMYEDTCLATNIRGEQSAEVLDLRMDCLRERLNRVKALTDVFIRPNATVIENAVSAASSVPPLDRCADVSLLRAVIPPPDEPTARARLESLRLDLARVRALAASGQCAASAAASRTLIAQAEALGYLPFLADSLIATSRSPGCAHDDLLVNARRAVLLGISSHHHEAAAEAAIHHALFVADRTPDIGLARAWIDVAGAILQGMSGSHPLLESWRIQALAIVYVKEGNDEKAIETFEQARALIEKTQGADHVDYANIHNSIGVFFFDRGRYDEALRYYWHAAQLTMTASGPEHSMLGMIRFNMAETLNRLRRHDEARESAERALAIWRRTGASAYFQACALTMLGEAILGQGRPREAVTPIAQAVELYGNDTSSRYPHEARFVLARALWASPAERPRALSVAREAKAGYEHLGNRPAEVAAIDAWLRGHLQR